MDSLETESGGVNYIRLAQNIFYWRAPRQGLKISPVHLWLFVENMILGQFGIRVFWFVCVSIIPPILQHHTLFICHRRHIILSIDIYVEQNTRANTREQTLLAGCFEYSWKLCVYRFFSEIYAQPYNFERQKGDMKQFHNEDPQILGVTVRNLVAPELFNFILNHFFAPAEPFSSFNILFTVHPKIIIVFFTNLMHKFFIF